MEALLVLGVTDAVVNKFRVDSMMEARNLKDFLEGTGDYQWVDIYQVRKTKGPLSEFAPLVLAAP